MPTEFVAIAKNSSTNLKNVFPQAAHRRWQPKPGLAGVKLLAAVERWRHYG